jgi:hypothetical protein
MKYIVECGASVQYFKREKILVYALSEVEAKRRAIEQFERKFEKEKDVENVGSVQIDSWKVQGK